MKTHCKYIFFVATIFINQMANSAVWEDLGENDFAKYQYDSSSVKNFGKTKKVLVKINELKNPKNGVKSRLLQILANCKDNTYLIENHKAYDSLDLNGKELSISLGKQNENKAEPDTVGQFFVDAACKPKPIASNSDSNSKDSNELDQRPLPNFEIINADNKSKVIYRFPLTYFNSKIADYLPRTGACQVKLNSNGKLLYVHTAYTPSFEVDLLVDKDQIDDIHFEWDNDKVSMLDQLSGFRLPVCVAKGDVYLSEIYAAGWKDLEARFDSLKPNGASCLKYGMEFKKLPYFTTRRLNILKYPSIYHPVSIEVTSLCNEIMKTGKSNYECTVGDNARMTRCDDEWVEYKDGQYLKYFDYKSIVEARLDGKKLAVVGFETKQAELEYKSKKAKQEQELAIQEQELAKRLEEAEKQKRWLETAEGKKHLAEQAAKQKLEAAIKRDLWNNPEKLSLSQNALNKASSELSPLYIAQCLSASARYSGNLLRDMVKEGKVNERDSHFRGTKVALNRFELIRRTFENNNRVDRNYIENMIKFNPDPYDSGGGARYLSCFKELVEYSFIK